MKLKLKHIRLINRKKIKKNNNNLGTKIVSILRTRDVKECQIDLKCKYLKQKGIN